jgi:hypothetical protein
MRTALAGAGAAGAGDAGASQGAAHDNGGSAWALVPVAADGDSTLQPGDKRLVVPLSASEATVIGRSQQTRVRRALPCAANCSALTRRWQIVDQTVKRQHASVTLLPPPHAAGAPVARVSAAHAVFLIRQHDATAAAAAAAGGLASPLRRAAPSVVRAGAEEMLCEGDLLFLLKDRHGYALRLSVGTPAEAPAARNDAPVEAPVAQEEAQAEPQPQPQEQAEAAAEEEPVHKRRKASAPKRRGKAAAAEG